MFCVIGVRLGGDVGPRELKAAFDVLFMSGVRIRAGAGGKKGEKACAGLGRFRLDVRGRAMGVIERGSRSTSSPLP